MLRDELKLELKYEVNIRFETQIWKSGPDLKMKNLEMRSWIPGLNLEKNCLKPGNGHFLVYFNKSIIKNYTFEDLVLAPRAKVFQAQSSHWAEVVLGPKCTLSQSMLGTKVSVGAKWSWGQTGCEPIYRLFFINWLPICALRWSTWLTIEVFEKKYVLR